MLQITILALNEVCLALVINSLLLYNVCPSRILSGHLQRLNLDFWPSDIDLDNSFFREEFPCF